MSTIAAGRMPTEGFLALDRESMQCEPPEKSLKRRSLSGSECLAKLGSVALEWAGSHQPRQYRVFAGVAAFRVPGRDASVDEIDLAIVPISAMTSHPGFSQVINCAPKLVIDILVPETTFGSTSDRIQLYREAGVPLIWIVDPDERTVKVHRPGRPPELFHEGQSLSGDPDLPEFTVPVKDLFECQ